MTRFSIEMVKLGMVMEQISIVEAKWIIVTSQCSTVKAQ